MTDETGGPDLDEVVAELRRRVERRREAGEYPPGLEHDLDDHFRRIVAHRATPDFTAVRALLGAVEERMAFSPDRIHAESHVPGGQALHRAVAKAVSRQTSGVLEQVQGYADAVRALLAAVVDALEAPAAHVHGELVGQVDAVLERMAAFERRALATETALADLTRRVEELEATSGPLA